MESRVTEIAPEVFRISTFHPDFGIQFNQFLIRDDEPFLMHTGFRKMFATTLRCVGRIIDPARLKWIGFSHFEPDECGALNHWLAVAPASQAVCGFVGAQVMLSDFADSPARALEDGDVLSLGKRSVRFLSSPHVPHGWDSGLFFEERDRTLFCSDLFFHPGDPEPCIESDVLGRAEQAIRAGTTGPLAHDFPYTPNTAAALRRLAALEPATLAVMHGSSFRGNGSSALVGLAAVLKETLSGEASPSAP